MMRSSWRASLALLLALAGVVLAPILLRRTAAPMAVSAAHSLTILTPHTEAVRQEFAAAFEADHFRRTGERVRIDWRSPGGASEIARLLESRYLTAFQNYWEHTLHRTWSGEVARSFAEARSQPATGSPAAEARDVFLKASVSCGVDLLFGGGAFEFAQHAEAGRLVTSGLISAHPEVFGPSAIPETFRGETLWDAQGRWFGVCLDAFGICSNRDALARLGLPAAPRQWADLADPRLRQQVALANPAQSGSVNKSFEMLIQQQIAEEIGGRHLSATEEQIAIRAGWDRAMRLLMRIGANARYFADSSSKISLDVAAGEAAAGATIGQFGRFESEALRRPNGSSRVTYFNAEGGTSYGADPVALLRGAPHAVLAREFLEWVLTPEAQRLWNNQVGGSEGPRRYALRRLPILPSVYTEAWDATRSDPGVNPYQANSLDYHKVWTGTLFRPIAFIMRVMCIEPHTELSRAWEHLTKNRFPPEATVAFSNIDAVSYDAALSIITPALRASKLEEVRLARELTSRFRAQYLQTEILARKGK